MGYYSRRTRASIPPKVSFTICGICILGAIALYSYTDIKYSDWIKITATIEYHDCYQKDVRKKSGKHSSTTKTELWCKAKVHYKYEGETRTEIIRDEKYSTNPVTTRYIDPKHPQNSQGSPLGYGFSILMGAIGVIFGIVGLIGLARKGIESNFET